MAVAKFNTATKQNQSQVQTIAPQMRQSLHMLSLSLPELRAELYREMASNPAIEDVESTLERETVSQKERETVDMDSAGSNDYPDDDAEPHPCYSADADALERRRKFFDSQTKDESLEEHLNKQIGLTDMDCAEASLAEMLIGDLDDNGYFSGSIPDIMMVTGESEERVRAVLKRITSFDPPGCGATSLEECLLAQIDKLDSSPYQQEVRELLERHHLSDIAEGKIAAVERDLGMSHERYADVLKALRTLEPRPGRAYNRSGSRTAYVNPEVHAAKADGRWVAYVDDRSLPDIHISKRYLKMLEDPATPAEAKEYIRGKIAAANALAEAIERREETVTNIAQAIFDAQPDFFEQGLKGLKPLTMQDIADKVGVHHTTVSRTVRDKYASTPRGTVELRRFFTSGYVTAEGEAVSRDSVFERLSAIVDGENKSKPYSDDRLSELLKAEGFPVARRTVAKYRGILGIPGTSERKVNG